MSVELEFKRGGLDLKDSHMSVMIYSLYLGTQDGFGFLKPKAAGTISQPKRGTHIVSFSLISKLVATYVKDRYLLVCYPCIDGYSCHGTFRTTVMLPSSTYAMLFILLLC